jgi:folate-binding protein YgfZ
MTPGYQALRHGAAWLDLSARGRIVARGRDRARLLHNLSSNDVKKMVPGEVQYAFLLNPQGRIQADLHLICFPDHFLLDTEPELREKVLQHIRRYIIADQVELEDVTDRLTSVAVEGPGAAALMEAAGVTGYELSLTGQPGFRTYTPAGDVASLIEKLGASGAIPATAEDARTVRIENGKPRYGEDIRDTSLPQETQQMHAVSFNKGCYLGQEIVERIRAQGRVNKKLVRIEMEGSEPLAPGTKVQDGEVTSSVFSPELGKVVALVYARAH